METDHAKNHAFASNREDCSNGDQITKTLLLSEGQTKEIENGKSCKTCDGVGEETTTLPKGPPWYKSKRYILSFILFGGVLNSFLQRAHLSIAIVCMVNHTATSSLSTATLSTNDLFYKDVMSQQRVGNETLNNTITKQKYQPGLNITLRINRTNSSFRRFGLTEMKTGTDDAVEADNIKDTTLIHTNSLDGGCLGVVYGQEEIEDGPFRWDKRTQGLLLGGFFWTLIVVPFVGNILIQYFPKRRIIAVSMAIVSGLTLLTHAAALWSPWAVFVLRLVQGGFTGLAVISIFGMWTQWAPPQERTGLIAISLGGSTFALAIVFPISGLLCKHGFWGGWPSIFYFFGVIGLGWSLIFILFTSETPALHPSITSEEKNYIETSLSSSVNKSAPPIPWRSILKSPPVWCCVCLQSTYSWGLYLVMSTMPQYMKEVLKFKIDSNGLFMMIPFLMTWFFTLICGQVINRVLKYGKIRLVSIRKIHAIIANVFPAIMLVIMSFLDCTFSTLAVAIFTMAVGIMGTNVTVVLTVPYDIAPQFAQPIITISNAFGSFMGVLAPYVVTTITKDKSAGQWQTVFFLTSGVLAVGAIIFCIWGAGEIQQWAVPNGETDKTDCPLRENPEKDETEKETIELEKLVDQAQQ